MKVYGGLTFVSGGNQVRTIVAAKSKKEAAALVGETIGYFNKYWSETGNKTEIECALAKPGQVLRASTSMGYDFK